ALGVSAASLSALSVVGVPSLKAQEASPVPVPGGILKVGLQADPTALDPHLQSLTAIWHVVEHIYNRLVRVQPDLTVAPELAESWEISEDGLTYTFALRPGVTFHNGRPMVASDVVYSFERLVDPATASTSAADLASMASVEAPDDMTVVLTLTEPDSSLLASLSGQSTIIIPREVVEENGDLSQVAVGTGPFVFVEYVPNTRIVLEKNPNFWEEGLPYLDGMELIPISEDTSRTTAVVTGTVDFIEYAPLRDIEILESDENLVIAGSENTNIRFLGFNLTREPFNDLRVRQAIAMVIDREAVLGPTVFGRGEATQILFPANFWAALDAPVSPPDIEGARALLAEAGYPDGFSTTITSWSAYSFLSNAAVVIQEQLNQIGIEAELNLVENSTMVDQVYVTKEFDMAVTGESAYVDPNTIVLGNFGTGESGNFAGYSNPEVDALITQGIAATDQAARTEIYQQIQEILLADLPWVNLFIANQYEVMSTDVKGYTHIPTGSNISLRETWLDR
ncbi:MAG: ABC transporter substrate-binding protein, partial [Chloroflexota bacterium]|nr:ABC transporter substrate-binding protein [Chloroflexota bacterium]